MGVVFDLSPLGAPVVSRSAGVVSLFLSTPTATWLGFWFPASGVGLKKSMRCSDVARKWVPRGSRKQATTSFSSSSPSSTPSSPALCYNMPEEGDTRVCALGRRCRASERRRLPLSVAERGPNDSG